MIEENEIRNALDELYSRVGTQKAMSELAGITQSTINAYLSGKAKIKNMPLGIFLKLFRDIKIDYFGENTGQISRDLLRRQLLCIFDSLDDQECVRMIAINAANFGEKLREETKH